MTVDEKYAREIAERLKLSEDEFQIKLMILKRMGFFAANNNNNMCELQTYSG